MLGCILVHHRQTTKHICLTYQKNNSIHVIIHTSNQQTMITHISSEIGNFTTFSTFQIDIFCFFCGTNLRDIDHSFIQQHFILTNAIQ